MEKWRPVASYGGFYSDYYEISNLGRIRSLDREILVTPKSRKSYIKVLKGELMNPSENRDGYLQTALTKNGRTMSPMVHRLVAETFIKNPKNKPIINHKNGIKTDNRRSNLEWCTHKENMEHASRTGLRPRGEDHSHTTISNKEVLEICRLLDENVMSREEIASQYNVAVRVIHGIYLGESWNWLTNRKGNIYVSDYMGKNNPAARAVINCRGEIFDTIQEAGKAYNISWTGVSRVIRGKGQSAGKYPDGTRIKWKYYSETT